MRQTAWSAEMMRIDEIDDARWQARHGIPNTRTGKHDFSKQTWTHDVYSLLSTGAGRCRTRGPGFIVNPGVLTARQLGRGGRRHTLQGRYVQGKPPSVPGGTWVPWHKAVAGPDG